MTTAITDQESTLLHALCWMCIQYLERPPTSKSEDKGVGYNPLLDYCMFAGQNAIEVLLEYGMVEERPGLGVFWTDEALEWLKLK